MRTYTLLKVIVGSQAHGLAGPDSDTDYRSVYVQPTEEILSLGHKYKGSQWLEGETEDNTAWELGHFLTLATQCNPTILEVFLSPLAETGVDTNLDAQSKLAYHFGLELRSLFPYIWSPQQAFDAFTGYGKNQQKKFLDKKDSRPHKYAVAHIRTLLNLIDLLQRGTFAVNMTNDPMFETLKRIKNKDYTVGEVVDLTEQLTLQAEIALEVAKNRTLNGGSTAYKTLNGASIAAFSKEERHAIANRFLLKVRREFYS